VARLSNVPWPGFPLGLAAAAALVCVVAGCSSAINKGPDATSARDQPDTFFDTIRNADLRPSSGNDASSPSSGQRAPGAQGTGPWIYRGEDPQAPIGAVSHLRSIGTQLASNDSGATIGAFGVQLNFESADIQVVSKSILGDVLGVNYIVDPRVQGTITMGSVGPIARKDVLTVFESALRTANAAVVRDGNIYRIVPLSETNGSGSFNVGSAEPGFGVSVVPLQYVSATTMAKMAENFLARPGSLRADAAGNFVMVQGTSSERQAAIEMITSFDVDWLRNQSVGVYPLKATTAEQMVRELQSVFDQGEAGRGLGIIRFQPITRMNAVMAVAKNPKLIDQATLWIGRLDRSDGGGTALRSYRLKYGDAKQVVAILNDIFANATSASGASTGETSRDQVAPGAPAGQSRLDALSTGNFAANGSSGAGAATPASTPGSAVIPGMGMASAGATGTGATNQSSSGTQFGAAFDSFDKKGADGDNATAKPIARGLLPYVRISADVPNNAVVIYSNAEDYRIIERALQQIDRPRLQVAIEATVAEVDLTDQLQYGVQYFLQSGNAGSVGLFTAPATSAASTAANTATTATSTATSTTSAVTSLATTAATTFLSQVVPGANLLIGSQTNPGAIISALATLTNVRVLSAPSIVVLDNQPALLEVGDQIPIQTSSAAVLTTGAPIVNTIQMQNTGVILKVLPHVRLNGTIQLEIDQEISSVENASVQTLTPTISDRRIRTTVVVGSSQTVLLGGLISNQDQSTKSGLPVLQNIQFLGALFSNTSTNKMRTEIIILMRPRVVRNGYDAHGVAEEFREKLDLIRHTSPVVSRPQSETK
jgi:general secretion pathway protein D